MKQEKNLLHKYAKKLTLLLKDSKELSDSVEKKGFYKYCQLYYFVEEILHVHIESGIELFEIYRYFIRLRRFCFKYINLIEDYFTSLVIEKLRKEKPEKWILKIKEISFAKTLGAKIERFFRKDWFFKILQDKRYFAPKKISHSKFELNLVIFLELRNIIAHNDLLVIGLQSSKNKACFKDIPLSINNLLATLELLIKEEWKESNQKRKWKKFHEKIQDVKNHRIEHELLSEEHNIKIDRAIKLINDFQFDKKIDFFIF